MSLINKAANEYNGCQEFFMWPVVFLLVLGLPFYFIDSCLNGKKRDTSRQVVSVCNNFEAYEKGPPLDSWGHALKLIKEEENNLINFRVTSAGKDGQFNTDDDIGASKQKYKSISRVAGKKAKEITKGFFKGLFD